MKKLLLLFSVLLFASCQKDSSLPPCCNTSSFIIKHIVDGEEKTSCFRAVCDKTALEQQQLARINIDSIVSEYWKCY